MERPNSDSNGFPSSSWVGQIDNKKGSEVPAETMPEVIGEMVAELAVWYLGWVHCAGGKWFK